MSTHALSGSGIQLLTAGTTALHVTITTLSPFGGIGNANPPNHYHQALLRPGDGTGFWAPVPVEGGPEWFGLPSGTDRLGYACEGGAAISVVEVIGGVSPFAGPPGADGAPGAAGPTGPTGPTGPAGGFAGNTYAGYNAIGATLTNMVTDRAYAKSVTTASDGFLASVGAAVKGNGSNVASLSAAVFADNAGSPDKLLAVLPGAGGAFGLFLNTTTGWLHFALGLWIPAGTYWIAVMRQDAQAAAAIQIANDTGADKYAPIGGNWWSDGSLVTWTADTVKYSIRASLLA